MQHLFVLRQHVLVLGLEVVIPLFTEAALDTAAAHGVPLEGNLSLWRGGPLGVRRRVLLVLVSIIYYHFGIVFFGFLFLILLPPAIPLSGATIRAEGNRVGLGTNRLLLGRGPLPSSFCCPFVT